MVEHTSGMETLIAQKSANGLTTDPPVGKFFDSADSSYENAFLGGGG